jgi:hypothetical protein
MHWSIKMRSLVETAPRRCVADHISATPGRSSRNRQADHAGDYRDHSKAAARLIQIGVPQLIQLDTRDSLGNRVKCDTPPPALM